MSRGNVARSERGVGEWVRAHQELSRLAALRARGDAEEGRALLAALRAGVHVFAGFGSFVEYVGHLFGYGPRFTHDKLRVAQALESLPQLAAALEAGGLHWSGVRELTRVASADTEAAWLEVARGKSARQLEALVAGASPGDAPGAERSAAARRHVLRFEVTAETFATVREAIAQLRRTSDPHLGDDAALLAMARAVLGGPADRGRASYQISLSVCPECARGLQRAAGEPVAVSHAIVEMARCDAQHLGPAASSANANDADDANESTLDVPLSPQAISDAAADPASDVCATRSMATRAGNDPVGMRSTVDPVDDDPAVARSTRDPVGGAPCVARSMVDEAGPLPAPPAPSAPPAGGQSSAHVGHEPRHRTTQSVPPALRRRVLGRDLHVCRVPGCGNSLFLDLHHVMPRAEGGANTASNLIALCGVHHRAVHLGELLIEGCSGSTLTFRHADGTPYGHRLDPRAIDVHAKVFSALRNLGFTEREARTVMDRLREEGSSRSLDVQGVLRVALQRLAPPARR
jgi:hypothetical protein